MPRIFLPQLSVEDCAIRESFPGGHRSLINSLIASSLSVHSRSAESLRKMGEEYDDVAPKYDAVTHGIYHDNVRKIATKYNYDGVVLDLGCGTGLFARLKGEAQGVTSEDPRNSTTKFIGVDISPQMRTECLHHGWYERVLVGPIQHVMTEWVDPVDHIVCIGALLFLDRNELSLVLSRTFQLARQSVTFTIDEIPQSYNAAQRSRGREYMHAVNHMDEVAAYGVPVGWKLADHWKCLDGSRSQLEMMCTQMYSDLNVWTRQRYSSRGPLIDEVCAFLDDFRIIPVAPGLLVIWLTLCGLR